MGKSEGRPLYPKQFDAFLPAQDASASEQGRACGLRDAGESGTGRWAGHRIVGKIPGGEASFLPDDIFLFSQEASTCNVQSELDASGTVAEEEEEGGGWDGKD